MTSTQEAPRHATSRRAFLSLAAGAALLPVATAAGSAEAATRPPDTIALPNGWRPEGITSGPGSTFYVGSLVGGFLKGDLVTGQTQVLKQPVGPNRSIRGLYFDARTGWVWAALTQFGISAIWALDGGGTIRVAFAVPGGRFLNDLVVTDDAVYVTDSQVDRLTILPLGPDGKTVGLAPFTRPLTGAWPSGDGETTNANGIRELADGSLVLNNSRVGGLWNVDPATGFTTEIPVRGGPGITGGDGLELDGDILYNVRGSGQDEVSCLLMRTGTDGWTARWAGIRQDRTLDVPSTATVGAGYLWAVNARFGVPSPDTASYWVTRLKRR